MKDLLQGLALLVGIPLIVWLLQMAWTLWRMPESEWLELQEHYEKRLETNRIIRFWLRGGK